MIWNCDINDSNLRYYLQKEQEAWKQYYKYNEQFKNAMANIQDEQVKKLIEENIFIDKKNLQTFSQQLQLCAELQIKFNKTLESIKQSDLDTLISLIDEILQSRKMDQDERIQIYITKNERKIMDAICEKYEEQMIQFFTNIGFPDNSTKQCGKQFDILKLQNYSKLTKHLLLIDTQFLGKLFLKINQHFNYHFIDVVQSTSEVSKPEWMFTYLYEKFQPTICQLFELNENDEKGDELKSSIKNLAIVMIKHFIVNNIQKRIKRDVDDFKTNPAQGLAFLEETFIFTKSMNEFLKRVDLEYNFFGETELIFVEQKCMDIVLEWEITLFKQNILQEYEDKIKEKKIHEFLNLVEEFEIVWNSQFEKYKLAKFNESINFTKLKVFSNFLQVCYQYFKIIMDIDTKDYVQIKNYYQVQFLQTYYIGLKAIKKQFAQFKKQIKELTNDTLTKWLCPLSNQCADQIYQQLFSDNLFEDKQFTQFSKQITKITLFQNHGIYFLQSNHEYAKKINNFYYKANIIINHMVAENLTKKEYTSELQQKVARMIIRRLQELISSSLKKMEFTQEGLLICFMVIVRTTYFVIISALNMEQHKYQQVLIKRFDSIELAIRKQPPKNMNEKDQQLIRNMKVIQI